MSFEFKFTTKNKGYSQLISTLKNNNTTSKYLTCKFYSHRPKQCQKSKRKKYKSKQRNHVCGLIKTDIHTKYHSLDTDFNLCFGSIICKIDYYYYG